MQCKPIALLVSTLLVLGAFSLEAVSSVPAITKQMIEDRNNQFSAKLNSGDDKELILFLHNSLSDSLQYKISYQNQFLPAEFQEKEITLGKTDYINSFVIGTNNIEEYEAQVETQAVKVSDDGKYAVANETIIEQGVMMNPHDLSAKGIAFYNETTCKNFYKINDGTLKSDKAVCRSATTHNDTI